MTAATLIFGANYWIAKGLMPVYFNPEQLVFYRVVTATSLFWLASLWLPYEKVPWQDLIRIAICSLLGVVLNQYFFFIGLKWSDPVEVAILHTLTPILILFFAYWIIRERITWTRFSGIMLGALGALLIILNGKHLDFSSDTFQGNLFVIANMTCYALYLVLIKPVMSRYHPVTVMKWAFLFGALMVIPYTVTPATRVAWQTLGQEIWIGFIFVVVATTFLAYLLVTMSLKKLSPSVVGFYSYLQPILASIHGTLLGKEKLTVIKVVATLIIFAGIYLVNKRIRYRLK